jgi:hypothetical protein
MHWKYLHVCSPEFFPQVLDPDVLEVALLTSEQLINTDDQQPLETSATSGAE